LIAVKLTVKNNVSFPESQEKKRKNSRAASQSLMVVQMGRAILADEMGKGSIDAGNFT
jgi:hypothetical protein